MITIDVLPGLVIGVVAMMLFIVYRASRPHVSASSAALRACRCVRRPWGATLTTERIPELLVLRFEAPLFYANASPVCVDDQVARGRRATLSQSAVILDVAADFQAGDITEAPRASTQLARTLRTAGIDFALAEVRQPVIEAARRTGPPRDDRRRPRLPHHRPGCEVP